MNSKGAVSDSARKLDDIKNAQELQLRQDGAALSAELKPMRPMTQMGQQTIVGCQEMIAWFVPLSWFRPGALTYSEMSCADADQRARKIVHAFLLALGSQPAMGRVTGKLMMGTMCVSERAIDSRGVKVDDVEETYNRFKTVAIWLTRGSIDANEAPRELMIREHHITREQAMLRLPPRFAPEPMTRDNVVGALFISVVRDPEATYARALEMTIRENQFLRGSFTVNDRHHQNIRSMCEKVYESGMEARLSESELFSLLFHPESQRLAALAATSAAVERAVAARAKEKLDKWVAKQELMAKSMDERRDRGEKVDEDMLEDTSPAARELKRAEFVNQARASFDRKSVPLWRLMQDLGYCPDINPDSAEMPEPLSSQQRLLRDVLITNSARRLPHEVSISSQPGVNPAETGAHARVVISSFSNYVDCVLGLAGVPVSDRQRQEAKRLDSMMTYHAVGVGSLLDPARHLTLERALERARAAGANSELLRLSNFATFDGVLFGSDLRHEYVKQPMTGPFSVPRVIMTRRPGASADKIPASGEINAVQEGAHRISDNSGIFKLELRWPDHTTVFQAGQELFEFNEDAQFPHTVDDFPARLEAAIDIATVDAANISQNTVDHAEEHIIDNLATAYRMLVCGDRDMMIDQPRSIDQMQRQTLNLGLLGMMGSKKNDLMSEDVFFAKFADMLSCHPAQLEAMMEIEVFRRGLVLRKNDHARSMSGVPVTQPQRGPISAEEARIASQMGEEPLMKLLRQTGFYATLAEYGDDSQKLRQQEGSIKRAGTHQLYYNLLPLQESARLLMVLDPAMWRKMLADQRRYCLDQFARVYYTCAPANGQALRSIAKWESCCYTGVSLGPMTVGAGMSMFGTFMATTLALNSETGGITNSPSIAADLIILRGDVFRMSSQMSVHPMLVGPAALGKTSLCARVTKDWSIPMTHNTSGSSSSKANKDLGALRLAFSVRVMDEPPHCLTHGTKMDTSRDSDEEFNALKRLLGDSEITYDRSLQGHGTQHIELNVRISLWCTANEFHFPKENSLMSRLWPTFCESGDRQGLDNTLIVRTLQPASSKSNAPGSALRSRWRHHQHFVALMTQVADCGGCLPPGVSLLGILSSMAFQRVGALIPGAANYPRLGGMALAIAMQIAYTRAFNVFCQMDEEHLHMQWRDGVSVEGADTNAPRSDYGDDPMEADDDNDDEYDSRSGRKSASSSPYDGNVDWVKTAGLDAKHIRRQFDIATINKMSPYATLTAESAMFVVVQMIDRIFPVHLHAVLYTLAVARGNWAPGVLDFLLGSQDRDTDMSMFNDTRSGGSDSVLEQISVRDPETDAVVSTRYVLSTFPRSREAFGRDKMPIFWAREEEYEHSVNNTHGSNRNGLLEHIKFATRDGFVDPNYIDISYNFGTISTFLRSAMANTQNPTDQALRYILSYCQNGQSNIMVPALERANTNTSGKMVLMSEDIRFSTQPSRTDLGQTSAVMHSIPAVQVVGGGQDRVLRISTIFLMLGAERFRLMNLYAMLESEFTEQDSRMIIPRTVPGQSNLYQTIRMNRRHCHYTRAPHPQGSGVMGSQGAASVTAMNTPVDISLQLPKGLHIRKVLAPLVTKILNTQVTDEISKRLNNWGYVEPRHPGESGISYDARNSVILSRGNAGLVMFDVRSIEDDCTLAHLQMNGLTFEEALPFLPCNMQQSASGRNAMMLSFNIQSTFFGTENADPDPGDLTVVNIGTPNAPYRTTVANMRIMMTYFANSGRLVYPDHFIQSRSSFNPETTDIECNTLGEMATEQFMPNREHTSDMLTNVGEPRRKARVGGRSMVRASEEDALYDQAETRASRMIERRYTRAGLSYCADETNSDSEEETDQMTDNLSAQSGAAGVGNVLYVDI